MRFLPWSLALALCMGPAGAHAGECSAPDYLVHPDGKLPHVAAAATQEKKLDILVLGTGSSTLQGAGGAAAAFPARLEASLKERLPGVRVTVRTDIAARRTAADMLSPLKRDLAETKPVLVIWQTGTVDAVRGVEPEEFRSALEDGVQILRLAGADIVLTNLQYSPRTEAMIATGAYLEAIRWVSQQKDVPLFDRLAVMKHWSEAGVFEFTSPDQKQLAERVHTCIGGLLAELIINAAGLNAPDPNRAQ